MVSVSLIGPAATHTVDCLIDTGADDTVFPEHLATVIGLDLTNAPVASGAGVGKVAFSLRFAEVNLRVIGNGELREWLARVAFTSAPLTRPLLGFAGFLEYFTATFYGDLEEVELAINSTYPGS